jgi:hypothetical protein
MDDLHKQKPNKLTVVIKETFKQYEPFLRFIDLRKLGNITTPFINIISVSAFIIITACTSPSSSLELLSCSNT